jgi:hypothetical protein
LNLSEVAFEAGWWSVHCEIHKWWLHWTALVKSAALHALQDSLAMLERVYGEQLEAASMRETAAVAALKVGGGAVESGKQN